MKILIPHSWSPSVGDMAVLTATVKMLEEAAPGAEVTALVSHPEFTKEKCDIKAKLERWPWPIPGARRSMLEVASYPFILMGHFLSAVLYRLFKARVFIFNRRFEGSLSAFFDCDVVLSPGGDFINPKYGFVTTFSEFMIAKILGKRIVICAQTIGPFTGLMHGRLAAAVLNLADLIIVREEKTAALLEEIGVKKFHVTADIVFTFPAPKKNPRKKRILICAERLDSLRQRKHYAGYLRRLGKRIMDEFGCEVVYMPANRADVDFQKEIISGLGGKISAIGEVRPPGKVAELASESEFLISSRMHPIILGTLSATPFFAIGDSFKFEEVLGVFCNGCSLKINELDDKSIETILERIREREKLRKMIAAKLPDAREKAMENGSILRRSFKEWNLK